MTNIEHYPRKSGKASLNKIRKLAEKRGTPLIGYRSIGNVVFFEYKTASGSKTISYPFISKGIAGEIKRLG